MAVRRMPSGDGGERLMPDAELPTNLKTLLDKAPGAFANNQAFLALPGPLTVVQVAAQVQALTRQVNALFKLTVDPSDTTGT